MGTPIARMLIANRGEIAARIIRTCRRLGIESVVTVSDADRDSLPAQLADRSVCIGPAHPTRSYLDVQAVVAAAVGVGADAVHPGYGFLAEEPALAETCAAAGMIFVGPPAAAIALAGNKVRARETAAAAGIPLLPASGAVEQPVSLPALASAAEGVGFPLLVKAAAGGGGRGMRGVDGQQELAGSVATAMAEAEAAFGDGTVYLERRVADALHVEVQVAGAPGRLAAIGDRDCSLQRRHQKVMEEGPASRVPATVRQAMADHAVRFAEATGYCGVGTVEFLFDRHDGAVYFLEMNARIQVEHPVTEELTGIDLVEVQIRLAEGVDIEPILASARPRAAHAVECRVLAEDPERGFRPGPGVLTRWRLPAMPGLRVETHCFEGYEVPPFYDSLLAKLVTTGSSRDEAIDTMLAALEAADVAGIPTNIDFLRRMLADEAVRTGRHNTTWIEAEMVPGAPARAPAG